MDISAIEGEELNAVAFVEDFLELRFGHAPPHPLRLALRHASPTSPSPSANPNTATPSAPRSANWSKTALSKKATPSPSSSPTASSSASPSAKKTSTPPSPAAYSETGSPADTEEF